ncbi:hypothetical protein EBB07_12780 [Paenibacillaceae bacterium]|nr:hypothetical protein EBB07_12780 [Paenibacillaceae bacterium]
MALQAGVRGFFWIKLISGRKRWREGEVEGGEEESRIAGEGQGQGKGLLLMTVAERFTCIP